MKLHPAEQYAQDAVAGRIVVGRLVKLSAQRHLADLRAGGKRGLYFDAKSAQDALDFFPLLRHSKGREFAGKPVLLEPWEQFIVWVLFGWKLNGNIRRFRTAHIEIAKKNGKTTFAAGLALYLAFFDGEPGAEVYCAATKKDQAKLVFDEAESMRLRSPILKKSIIGFRNNMHVPATNSKFEPLGADEKTLDGPNIHGLIFDELHAVQTRLLWDVLEQGTAARKQPMTIAITTAGYDRESVCWNQREYGVRVLEGLVADDSFFTYVACLDDGDDWKDERNWIKANPNLGVSIKIEDLRQRAHKAANDPSALNAYLRLRLNKWTSQDVAAIDADSWKACCGYPLKGIDARVLLDQMAQELLGERCFIGVDLSSTQDVTALVKVFPPNETREKYVVIPHFWIPEDNLQARMKEWRAPYDVWAREGFIETTEGSVIDYDPIKARILADCEAYDVQEVAFDPWNAQSLANDLQKEGIPPEKLIAFRQQMQQFATPTAELLDSLIPRRTIAHLANPVLAWMAGNLVIWQDGNGGRRPTKKSSKAKIDGMVALIMGLGRAIANAGAESTGTYSGAGVWTA